MRSASGNRPCSGTCAQTMPESESSSALGRLGRRGLWNERASARNKLLPIEQDLPVWRHCPQSGCASSHLTFLLRHSKLIDQARPSYLAPIAVAGNMAPNGHRSGSGVGLKWETTHHPLRDLARRMLHRHLLMAVLYREKGGGKGFWGKEEPHHITMWRMWRMPTTI